MKIIHYLYELKFSGAEIMYVDASSIFQKLGCELSVVNSAYKMGEFASSFEKAGYKVFHFPYPKGIINRYKYYKNTIDFLKKEKYDVVHIHSSAMKWGLSYCAWRAGCKSLYTFHAIFRSHWYSYPLHWWLRWSAKHIFGCTFQTISDSVYENEKKYYFNKTVKIYNWYGSNRFYPALTDEKQIIRNKLKIPQDALVIISVGGCNFIKRHTEIIKALPEIIKEYSNTIYLHLGEGISTQEEVQLVKKLGIEKYVYFCGNQNDVRQYLIASDIYVMTSRNEGISLTTIEAMACLIPSVLYNVPGLRDFNKEKECSELIPEDYKLLADTIIKLYKNKERQLYLINNAKELVNCHFYMETNAKRIFELYKK